jgi:hypothetical protein
MDQQKSLPTAKPRRKSRRLDTTTAPHGANKKTSGNYHIQRWLADSADQPFNVYTMAYREPASFQPQGQNNLQVESASAETETPAVFVDESLIPHMGAWACPPGIGMWHQSDNLG